MRRILPALVVAAMLCPACGDSTGPTPTQSTVTISMPSPASGSTIFATGTLPGAFIPRGSGRLSIPITVTAGREVPWATLWVYLMTGPNTMDYCGQNLPDAPTWAPFLKAQTASFSISGFQVFRLPCEVTGLRAFLHTRQGGLLTPPTVPTDILAEGSINVVYHVQQQ